MIFNFFSNISNMHQCIQFQPSKTTIKTFKSKVLHDDTNLVRRSGLGVVSWTCDPVLALVQRFDSHSRRSFGCNSLGYGIYCTLPSLLGWDLKVKTGGCVSVQTFHCTHIKSHLTLRKRVGVGPCGL